MKRQHARKLVLNKQTVRHLTVTAMKDARGGWYNFDWGKAFPFVGGGIQPAPVVGGSGVWCSIGNGELRCDL